MSEWIYWIKEGKPHFLNEIESGVFGVVRAIETNDGIDEYQYSDDFNELILGRDLAEIPTRNITLILRCKDKGVKALVAIIHECKKLGEVCNVDFVSCDLFSEKMARLIAKEDNGWNVVEIRPRLFKKINGWES
jgi:hypothetical protein